MNQISAYFALITVILSLIGTIIGCGIWIGRRQGELISIKNKDTKDDDKLEKLSKDLEDGLNDLDNKLHRYKTEMQKALTEQSLQISTTYVRKDNLELQLQNIKEKQEETSKTVNQIHTMLTSGIIKVS